jgi:chemotaxis protein CheD
MISPQVHRSLPGSNSTHILHPGDVALGFSGDTLETLLGSCVSLILVDPRRTIGAMCHIVHSGDATSYSQVNSAHAQKAILVMFGLLQSVGISPHLCDSYVYGGANMFPGLYSSDSVGQRNVQWMLNFLHDQDIRVIEQFTGGTSYRKVKLLVGAGEPELIETEIRST